MRSLFLYGFLSLILVICIIKYNREKQELISRIDTLEEVLQRSDNDFAQTQKRIIEVEESLENINKHVKNHCNRLDVYWNGTDEDLGVVELMQHVYEDIDPKIKKLEQRRYF